MKFQQLSPILWTKDLKETIYFYESILGFQSRSNFPNFVALFRDEAEIMFVVPQDEPEDCKSPENKEPFFPKPMLTGSIYFFIKDVDQLWESLQQEAKIKTPIADREYMMRDFSIYDNNGYELVFGEDISIKNQ